MKLSIAWIFDHIDAAYNHKNIPALIAQLNQKTAEIERSYPIATDFSRFSIATVTTTGSTITAFSDEWDKQLSLASRDGVLKGQHYIVIKEQDQYRWATSLDLGGHKEMLLPALAVDKKMIKGGWKKSCEQQDYIFEIDNKSINHRPDLWGHRGFAREIAAILNLPLKPLKKFCAAVPVITEKKKNNWHLTITPQQGCNRLAGVFVPDVECTPALPWMAVRLSRVDSRSINALVDTTNYVMLDISQPMHAFDAQTVAGKELVARRARAKESLTLLDDQTAELTPHDLIIADGEDTPIALAGIMGGASTAVTDTTKALFLESANFDAATIRRSSQRHKIRTEASARFEKSLDPNQNITALTRYIKLLDENNIGHGKIAGIISQGALLKEPVITVRHSFIQDRLGITLASSFVKETLKKLDFKVAAKKIGSDYSYTITVPAFRATKDVTIPEDIVEEIGRFFGYSNIPAVLPKVTTKAVDQHEVIAERRIKQLLAFGLSMHEIATYAFFDEAYLQTIKWQPNLPTANVKDPVSHNWYRLATTLMPVMFKAVAENQTIADDLRFFEWGRTWQQAQDIIERKVLTGIFYKKDNLTFYDAKAELEKLFVALGLSVTWSHAGDTGYPWFDYHQTALLSHEGKTVGLMGTVDRRFMDQIAPGAAVIFELDVQALLDFRKPVTRFEPLPKYPSISRDISMLAPLALTVAELTDMIMAVDGRIREVRLVDMFQKKEWQQERALTLSFLMRDNQGTMVKQQADEINEKVVAAVAAAGATIR